MKRKKKATCCLTLTDVINKVNFLPKSQHVNIEKLTITYGGTDNVLNEMRQLLKQEFKGDIEIEKTFIYTKRVWSCKINLGSIIKESFEGIGITKQTAEHNSCLAAMLWLKELSATSKKAKHVLVPSHDDKQIIVNDIILENEAEVSNSVKKKQRQNDNLASVPNSEVLKTLFDIVSRQTNSFSVQSRLFCSSAALSTRGTNVEPNVNQSTPLISKSKVPAKDITGSDAILYQSDYNNNTSNNLINTDISKKLPSEYKHITLGSHAEVQHIHAKYPAPKNVLHSYYQVLLNELKDKSLKIDLSYKCVRTGGHSEWICTYHLNWPEQVKVSAKEKTKKLASTYAALKCLAYLSECGKISKDGMPLIYTKEEVRTLTQRKEKEVTIGKNSVEKMQQITDIFAKNIHPLIKDVDYKYEEESVNTIVDPDNMHLKTAPIYLRVDDYLAKEKQTLPVSDLKELFIQMLEANNCIIVKGQPGCGKSTRIPQYVLESWVRDVSLKDKLCRIAVTQPRRIAAISLSERVANERNEMVGNIVGYQVRLKSKFQPKTGRILYCTTGILLRHLQTDPKLTTFSHVILDEAHERDLNTDLLMIQLKRAMKENSNLKVIVMSATIDAHEFSKYFGGAPIFDVPGFTYPVTQHYLDDCRLDVSKTLKMCKGDNPQVVHEDVAQVIKYIHNKKPEGAILVFLPGWEDLTKVQRLISYLKNATVHMVHSKLKDSEQYKIFSKPPSDMRKIILATNIAETSITIDDVVYVIDTGIHKDQIFDNDKGISVIDMEWISKASADQRAGRAGRCAPGEAYHLYTVDKYKSFNDYSTPKILNSSLTKVVLDSKTLVRDMSACDFMNNLITPPEKIAVERAVEELKRLELLNDEEKLTPLGRTLVNFQLEPYLAKTMVNSVVFKCTTPIVDIITLFSSETEMFGSLSLIDKESIKNLKLKYSKSSDHLAVMRVYEKWLELMEEGGRYEAARFCGEANLVPHKMEYISKLKDIHYGYLYSGLYDSVSACDDYSDNDELVKAVLYSGTGNVLTHRNWDNVKNRLKTNVNVLVTRNNHKATITLNSVNYKRHKFPSEFLVYMNETRSNIRRTSIVRECSLIPAISLLLFCNNELYIKPVEPYEENAHKNLVSVSIKNTNLKFLLTKEEADTLVSCKTAIDSSYRYIIHQLTNSGEDITEFSQYWNEILKNLDVILTNHKIE